MSGWGHDLRHALRAVRRQPTFSVLVPTALALGIGLNSAAFGLVDALLFRPLPVAEPERLVYVYSSVPGDFLSHAPMAFPDYEAVRDEAASTLTGAAAYAWYPLALERGDGSELMMAELVTGNYFGLLGVEPSLGRALTPEDDRVGDPAPVAVLSHDAWRRIFAAAPQAIGREMRLNGRSFTVVGIAPRAFRGLAPGLAPDLWLPIRSGATLPTGVTVNFGPGSAGIERTAPGGLAAGAGRLRPRVAARLGQRGEPVPGPGARAAARDRDPARAGRGARAPGATALPRGPAAGPRGRRPRAGPGVGDRLRPRDGRAPARLAHPSPVLRSARAAPAGLRVGRGRPGQPRVRAASGARGDAPRPRQHASQPGRGHVAAALAKPALGAGGGAGDDRLRPAAGLGRRAPRPAARGADRPGLRSGASGRADLVLRPAGLLPRPLRSPLRAVPRSRPAPAGRAVRRLREPPAHGPGHQRRPRVDRGRESRPSLGRSWIRPRSDRATSRRWAFRCSRAAPSTSATTPAGRASRS